jgi:hypothetical protein
VETNRRSGLAWLYLLVGVVVGIVLGQFVVLPGIRPAMRPSQWSVKVDDTGQVDAKHVGICKDCPSEPPIVHWKSPVGTKLRIDILSQYPPTPPVPFLTHCNPNSPNECWSNPLTPSHTGLTYTYKACVTPPGGGDEKCNEDPWIHVDA